MVNLIMAKKIIKIASKEKYLELPKPSKFFIPDWYKKSERFVGGVQLLKPSGSFGQKTIKTCAPFLDSLTAGYCIELWQDLQVIQETNGPMLYWAHTPEVASLRSIELHQEMPTPEGYFDAAFAWASPFYIKTPPGYSILVTHPLNRLDLPFITLSGIVDSDKGMSDGNIPFFINKTFQGIIPKGTPIAQIIPFKRDDWKSEEDSELIEIANKNKHDSLSSSIGWYKNKVWQRKRFE